MALDGRGHLHHRRNVTEVDASQVAFDARHGVAHQAARECGVVFDQQVLVGESLAALRAEAKKLSGKSDAKVHSKSDAAVS